MMTRIATSWSGCPGQRLPATMPMTATACAVARGGTGERAASPEPSRSHPCRSEYRELRGTPSRLGNRAIVGCVEEGELRHLQQPAGGEGALDHPTRSPATTTPNHLTSCGGRQAATSVAVDDAIRRYPELGRLFALMSRAWPRWRFNLVEVDGVVVGLLGRRVWPEGTVDSLGISSQWQARVVRVDPLGTRVFEKVDTVSVVVDTVAERLVSPSDPVAPHRALPRVVSTPLSTSSTRCTPGASWHAGGACGGSR